MGRMLEQDEWDGKEAGTGVKAKLMGTSVCWGSEDLSHQIALSQQLKLEKEN